MTLIFFSLAINIHVAGSNILKHSCPIPWSLLKPVKATVFAFYLSLWQNTRSKQPKGKRFAYFTILDVSAYSHLVSEAYGRVVAHIIAALKQKTKTPVTKYALQNKVPISPAILFKLTKCKDTATPNHALEDQINGFMQVLLGGPIPSSGLFTVA